MLMKLISWNDYKTESASSRVATFLSKDINAVIASNAAAAQSAASSALAAALTQFESSFEQIVTISAEFPNVVDHNEIQEALNNIINDAAQYANRKY